MSYRKSGGYVPDTPASPPDPQQMDLPDTSLDMTLDTVDVATQQTPPPQQNNSMTAPLPMPSIPVPLPLDGIEYPDFLQMPEMDASHHVIFDASDGAQGLVEDLDWLFGNVPFTENLDMSQTLDMSLPNDLPWASPNSTLSQQLRILDALRTLPQDLLEDQFFDPSNLKSFLDSYFSNYNAHFPILHQASFALQDTSPLLLVAILTLGATLSPDPLHYRASERIHESLRWLIFSSGSFQPPAPLWYLQALLLVQACEKMFSTRKRHEMAHIFHGAVITLMRRGGSYSSDGTLDSSSASSAERAWHMWVEQESFKRVAYFAFIMDAQHSSIFGHTPALSISDVHFLLPCADEVWDSSSTSSWKKAFSKAASAIQFLPTLRALLARRPMPSTCSPFARFVLLHGLFNVTKHMQARDLMASDIETGRASDHGAESTPSSIIGDDNWKEILDRAIDTWSFSLMSQQPSLSLEAARPLHRMAHVTIYVNLIDFHTFAGAPSLTGSSTTRHEYTKAKRRIQMWCQKPIARRTLSHRILLIQETMFTRNQYRASLDNIAPRPWCLYHATLILWAFGILTEGKPAEKITAEDYLVHMLSGLMDHHTQLKGTNKTLGLISVVKDSLSDCRWELLQEACTTLGKLIESSAS
ncbi:fungal-specific transcription factor domain-containing protein [Exophiala viscosa]|uniref:Fungal-specific transcription factor domain-containing protein n=1 Tax=Exophiala viscosa TaxID=2486360 RepID=A0AAN6DQM7_9EURO|nr:fungal-specific transcription factor domain-containing protein [Exophiala viscosa]